MIKQDMVFEIAALLVVSSVVSLGAGYWIAGGVEKFAEQYSIGENIVVHVKAPESNNFVAVHLKSGMTALDAIANVIPITTELYTYGPAVKTADNQWLVYTVNGETPSVGMDKYQLSGGENIELSIWG